MATERLLIGKQHFYGCLIVGRGLEIRWVNHLATGQEDVLLKQVQASRMCFCD